MVREHWGDYPSLWTAIESIAGGADNYLDCFMPEIQGSFGTQLSAT